jgi:2-polyprenyl-3-methyl-5-hydroxy-6-metoxy-1,4-benzoquinol methylase
MAADNHTMNTHVNADPAELAKFSDLAHRWWDPESEFRPLHQINPLRLNWIDGLVNLNGKQCWMWVAAAASCPTPWPARVRWSPALTYLSKPACGPTARAGGWDPQRDLPRDQC